MEFQPMQALSLHRYRICLTVVSVELTCKRLPTTTARVAFVHAVASVLALAVTSNPSAEIAGSSGASPGGRFLKITATTVPASGSAVLVGVEAEVATAPGV